MINILELESLSCIDKNTGEVLWTIYGNDMTSKTTATTDHQYPETDEDVYIQIIDNNMCRYAIGFYEGELDTWYERGEILVNGESISTFSKVSGKVVCWQRMNEPGLIHTLYE